MHTSLSDYQNNLYRKHLGTHKSGNKELRRSAAYKRLQTQILSSDFDSLLDTQGHAIITGNRNTKHLKWNNRKKEQQETSFPVIYLTLGKSQLPFQIH